MTIQNPFPINPDSVRVWCGYKHHSMSVKDFQEKLGNVFIPACVKLQTNLGLTAYVPTILLGIRNKELFVPDETALVFYKSQKAYRAGFNTLAERIYAMDHHGVFSFEKNDYEFASYSDFPIYFKGNLKIKTPVYLFKNKADWMNGSVKHFVATRPDRIKSDKFLNMVANILSTIQKNKKLEGAIACIDKNYFVYWELINSDVEMKEEFTGISLLEKSFTEWKKTFTAKKVSLPKGLWEDWSGMKVVDAGSSFNLVFERESRNGR